MVMFQHRFYLPLVLVMNVGLPLLLGWAVGDVWGVFLLAGVLRLRGEPPLHLVHQFARPHVGRAAVHRREHRA